MVNALQVGDESFLATCVFFIQSHQVGPKFLKFLPANIDLLVCAVFHCTDVLIGLLALTVVGSLLFLKLFLK